MGRRFGQHFLSRKSILDRIASVACEGETPLVIEIGPGKGALTESLLACAAKSDCDRGGSVSLVHYLRQKFQTQIGCGKLTVVEGDSTCFRRISPCLAPPSSPEICRTTSHRRFWRRPSALGKQWKRAVFLVQAEVAARLAAEPGTRDFGYLKASKPSSILVPKFSFR